MPEKGLVLVEVLIAVGAALLVLAVIFGTFIMLEKRRYKWEAQVPQMQENVRAGMRMMTQELPMAGSDPSGAAGAGLVVAGSDTIRFTMDLNGDGDISDTGEDITYALDKDRLQLTRNGQPLAENIPPDGLLFEYFDGNGHELASTPLSVAARDRVSRVSVRLTARTAKPDPDYPLDGGYRSKTLTSDVVLRNLALAAVSTTATTTTATTTTATTTAVTTTKAKTTKATTTKATMTETTATAETTTSTTTTTEYVDTEGPLISEISQIPDGSSIPGNVTVSICAAVTDPSGVKSVTLLSDRHGDTAMSLYVGDTYCGNLSKMNNETVTYYIIAHDSLGYERTSGPYSYYQGE